MWIFTKDWFASVVRVRDSDDVVVRFRDAKHAKKAAQDLGVDQNSIVQLPNRDYGWRFICPKQLVARVVADKIQDLDYTNFKNAACVDDKAIGDWYNNVWREGFMYQEDKRCDWRHS